MEVPIGRRLAVIIITRIFCELDLWNSPKSRLAAIRYCRSGS